MVHAAQQMTPDPAPSAASSWGDRVRFVLRGIGQTLISLGVVVLLFVVYEVYVTNYFAAEDQKKVKSAIEKIFVEPGVRDPVLQLPGQSLPKIPDGEGIAILYIPRLGNDYSFAIVQGTNQDDLEKGPGHYAGTALPGQAGNFGVAGHRVGKGEPFLNLDQLRPGDPVIVQTKTFWYVYKVLGADGNLGATNVDGVPGREVVSPGDGNVLLPVPDHPGLTSKADVNYMTMTTCHPKFTAENRMVVYSSLFKRIRADGLTFPALVKSYYSS